MLLTQHAQHIGKTVELHFNCICRALRCIEHTGGTEPESSRHDVGCLRKNLH